MRTNQLIYACLCVLAVGAAVRGQSFEPDFRGTFIDPVGGNASGLGTPSVQFIDGSPTGSLTFTASADIHPATTPFLLGRIDFTAGTANPSSITFQVTADVFDRNCAPSTLAFTPKIRFEEFSEPGLTDRTAIFSPANSSTVNFDGSNYTFAFAGLSASTEWNAQYGDSLGATVGQNGNSAYLFATLDPLPPRVDFGPPANCGCEPPPSVPEPATWLLFGIGAIGWAGVKKWKRS